MARLKTMKDDKRLQGIIDTAEQTLQYLRDRDIIPPTLVTEIDAHVRQSFSPLSGALTSKRIKEFDTLGTEIWNGSASLFVDFEESDDQHHGNNQIKAGVLLRLFALLILGASCAVSLRRDKVPGQQLRLLSVANRTAKLCLDKNQLDLSVTALEVGTRYLSPPAERPELVSFAGHQEQNLTDHELSMKRLEREFYLLRMLHAWRSERRDLADHFFLAWSRLQGHSSESADSSTIAAADLFYEFARELTKAEAGMQAMKWYERALSAIYDTSEQGNHESGELLTSVAVAYIEELLKSGQGQDLVRSREVLSKLEDSHILDNRITTSVLKLRVLATVPGAESEEIQQAMLHIIKHTVLTEDNFMMIMQVVRKANESAPEATLSALRMFILQRLMPEATSIQSEADQICEWLEKATITYTMYAVSQMLTAGTNHVENLGSLFDAIRDSRAPAFSAKATHAAQTLIWKATNGPNDAVTRGCCSLLRHSLFDNAGYVNKGRIGRKVIRSALQSGELPLAREAFLAMPGNVQNEPATRYLTFQLALRSDDIALATESLRIIVNCSTADSTYLYACVLEAQQIPASRHMAVASLRAILDRRPNGLQLGSLLRCMARLFLAELKVDGADKDQAAREAVSIFEMAAASVQDIRKCPAEQWYTEVQWWSKNAYNLSIELCSFINPEQLLRLLSACMVFLDHYPKEPEIIRADELGKRKSLCLLLSTTSLVVLGRSNGKNHLSADVCFTKAQQAIAAFKQQQEHINADDPEINARTLVMLKFELECVLRLRQWHLLDSILKSCLELNTVGRWDALADLMIVVHEHLNETERVAHVSLIAQLLQKIINDTWKKDKNITKVSRWLRFAFMLCITHEKGDFARKLLDQASRMAENGQRGKFDMYPESELQWLATTGFNHAIDLIASDQQEDVTTWLDAAMDVARWAQDNGALHAILSSKRQVVEERMRSESGSRNELVAKVGRSH